ncbi:MAG: hypothetical protein VX278_16845, partial [Myxococcota bacterium]|nr:hypothetical protein [Myxococcota bacterium]
MSNCIFLIDGHEDVERNIRTWLYGSDTEVHTFESFKRAYAEIGRLNPAMILLDADLQKSGEHISQIKSEERFLSTLVVGLSSGYNRETLFSSMLQGTADYYAKRPIKRGFLDQLLARTLGESIIAQDRSKVDLKDFTSVVEDLKKERTKNRELETIVSQRDELQVQLADALQEVSTMNAKVERLNIEIDMVRGEKEGLDDEISNFESTKEQLEVARGKVRALRKAVGKKERKIQEMQSSM